MSGSSFNLPLKSNTVCSSSRLKQNLANIPAPRIVRYYRICRDIIEYFQIVSDWIKTWSRKTQIHSCLDQVSISYKATQTRILSVEAWQRYDLTRTESENRNDARRFQIITPTQYDHPVPIQTLTACPRDYSVECTKDKESANSTPKRALTPHWEVPHCGESLKTPGNIRHMRSNNIWYDH